MCRVRQPSPLFATRGLAGYGLGRLMTVLLFILPLALHKQNPFATWMVGVEVSEASDSSSSSTHTSATQAQLIMVTSSNDICLLDSPSNPDKDPVSWHSPTQSQPNSTRVGVVYIMAWTTTHPPTQETLCCCCATDLGTSRQHRKLIFRYATLFWPD